MDADYGSDYRELYRRHWWWRAREAILSDVIESIGLAAASSILDVGCGDALAFPMLERFGAAQGIETDVQLLDPAGSRRHLVHTQPLGSPLYQGWQFDLVTALDVIEHLEDDHLAMRQLLELTKPGGWLLLTVPASMRLWDRHDEVNRHYRRYTSETLREILPAEAILVDMRYLFHAIYPLKWLVARINRLRPERELAQHAIPGPAVNAIMERLCRFEYRYLRRLNLPFGTSLVALIQRPGG